MRYRYLIFKVLQRQAKCGIYSSSDNIDEITCSIAYEDSGTFAAFSKNIQPFPRVNTGINSVFQKHKKIRGFPIDKNRRKNGGNLRKNSKEMPYVTGCG
jgi:hypothetical protein